MTHFKLSYMFFLAQQYAYTMQMFHIIKVNLQNYCEKKVHLLPPHDAKGNCDGLT